MDVENVLLYNVGTAFTRHLMTAGVIIERAYEVPAAPNGDPALNHHVRYTSVPATTGFEHWPTGAVVATITDAELDRVDKPAHVWVAIRRQTTTPTSDAPVTGGFAVRLQLTPPATFGTSRSVADLIKPLLDGVISAFHSHIDQAT